MDTISYQFTISDVIVFRRVYHFIFIGSVFQKSREEMYRLWIICFQLFISK